MPVKAAPDMSKYLLLADAGLLREVAVHEGQDRCVPANVASSRR